MELNRVMGVSYAIQVVSQKQNQKKKERERTKICFEGSGRWSCRTRRISKGWLHQMLGPDFEMSRLHTSTHRLWQTIQGILDVTAFWSLGKQALGTWSQTRGGSHCPPVLRALKLEELAELWLRETWVLVVCHCATQPLWHREKSTHNWQKIHYPFHQDLQSGHDKILINSDYLGLYNLVAFPHHFQIVNLGKGQNSMPSANSPMSLPTGSLGTQLITVHVNFLH